MTEIHPSASKCVFGSFAGVDPLDQICGTCSRWEPPTYRQISHTQFIDKESYCHIFNEPRNADYKPLSWCWKIASNDLLIQRVELGLFTIKGGSVSA